MSQALLSPDERPPAADAERWALVQRIASSRHFARAVQLHDILLFISRRAMEDPAKPIREHDIGCGVLGRRPDFNPQEDNIVRVQVSHLRKKLQEYFESEGRDETLRLTVPRGSYVPRFEPITSVSSSFSEPRAAESDAPVRRAAPTKKYIFAISALVALAACLYLGLRYRPASRLDDAFWSRIFSGDQPANIVVADTCLVMMQDILGADVSLPSYLSKDYPRNLLSRTQNPELRLALDLISSRQYTSLGDINIASKLTDLSGRFKKATIRYSRHLNIRDFKTQNFVLIGSRRGIPWVQLFEPQLSFALQEDPDTHRFFFYNRSPKAGEQNRYEQKVDSGNAVETYSDVAFLRNLGNNGYVLILSGISMEAAEAAGDMVTNPGFSKTLLQTSGLSPSASPFEILLRTRAVAGAPQNSQIVAYRLIQPHLP